MWCWKSGGGGGNWPLPPRPALAVGGAGQALSDCHAKLQQGTSALIQRTWVEGFLHRARDVPCRLEKLNNQELRVRLMIKWSPKVDCILPVGSCMKLPAPCLAVRQPVASQASRHTADCASATIHAACTDASSETHCTNRLAPAAAAAPAVHRPSPPERVQQCFTRYK